MTVPLNCLGLQLKFIVMAAGQMKYLQVPQRSFQAKILASISGVGGTSLLFQKLCTDGGLLFSIYPEKEMLHCWG